MNYTITVSGRAKLPTQNIQDFLKSGYPDVNNNLLDSIFGFTEDRCRIYGGRPYIAAELTENDLQWMYDHNIGYRIPLTSSVVTEDLYKESIPFLEKHHKKGNSVIIVKNNLAKWIRRDFPLYSLEASVIKEISDVYTLQKSLELYDTVVPLPSAFNVNLELLSSLDKETIKRIRLFLTTGCAFKCPAKLCYGYFSKFNRGDKGLDFECSQKDPRYMYQYDGQNQRWEIEPYLQLGFNKFKMLRNHKPAELSFGKQAESKIKLSAY
jgi:hypothetical protein